MVLHISILLRRRKHWWKTKVKWETLKVCRDSSLFPWALLKRTEMMRCFREVVVTQHRVMVELRITNDPLRSASKNTKDSGSLDPGL